MLYMLHEMQQYAMAPMRLMTDGIHQMLDNPMNPFRDTPIARNITSALSVFEQVTRRYGKPDWGLTETEIDGNKVAVHPEAVIHRTYCHLVHFRREAERDDPKLLIVAPMSGHYATLLRGTVEAMIPDHDVYITDWQDCRFVPITADRFNLADYIDYVIDFLHYLGPNTHVLAVCQPSVPVLAAISVMSQWGDLCAPASTTLIGGPIDTRKNPTAVNKLALEHPVEWFEDKVIQTVPPPYPGVFRKVYPGFIQLTNFVSMNLDKHMESLNGLFEHLVQGDEEQAQRKRDFYDEYLAVMDLPAEFYLSTVKTVFQDHALPKGEMIFRWHAIEPWRINRTALLCIEGELDDICGVGQTKAALELTTALDSEMKEYYMQEGAGHYGVFNGGKFRREIAPRIAAFIREHDHALIAQRHAAARAAGKEIRRRDRRKKERRQGSRRALSSAA
ncbi:MAG: polyhydroxyalkanoate depolymerase [Alphaproteobacteria bacterium]